MGGHNQDRIRFCQLSPRSWLPSTSRMSMALWLHGIFDLVAQEWHNLRKKYYIVAECSNRYELAQLARYSHRCMLLLLQGWTCWTKYFDGGKRSGWFPITTAVCGQTAEGSPAVWSDCTVAPPQCLAPLDLLVCFLRIFNNISIFQGDRTLNYRCLLHTAFVLF